MKQNKNTLFNAVTDMTDKLTLKPYAVTGFHFVLDQQDEQINPYDQSVADEAGFPFVKGMPEIKGFFYASEEYESYLSTLQIPLI